jgi:uncharacterized membrane protein
MRNLKLGLIAQSAFYVLAGINHFWHQAFYVHIMPDHYPHPEFWVRLSGMAEIAGGLGLLFPATRRASAIGIVAMLVVFLDVHQFMLRHAVRFPEVPLWALWARIPFQFVLIACALYYARKRAVSQA